MITITNIRNKNLNSKNFDQIWSIVRSNKNLNFTQVPELAPSTELFKYYLNMSKLNQFDDVAFNEVYVPQFIDEFTTVGKNLLKYLRQLDMAGKNIALVCYCADESKCHRSIIAGILQGMKVNVTTDTEADYSHYYEQFLKVHGKKNKS